jgi:uncharacterized protein YoaH (UPF0181 family)
MPPTGTTEAQVVYERIEALKAEGFSNADAIRRVAEERGKTVNAVRANQHQHRQKVGDRSGARPTRRSLSHKASKPMSVQDAVTQARRVLQQALDGLDSEIVSAKADLDAAQTRYDLLISSMKDRKRELETKIKALG